MGAMNYTGQNRPHNIRGCDDNVGIPKHNFVFVKNHVTQ